MNEFKKRLEELKGDKEWGEFFLDLCTENQRLKGKKVFEELRELLTDEDLEVIRKSSKEFRDNFKLRSTS